MISWQKTLQRFSNKKTCQKWFLISSISNDKSTHGFITFCGLKDISQKKKVNPGLKNENFKSSFIPFVLSEQR